MDLGLRDQVYVVTGGTRGIGLATAQVLVAEGARVVVSGRDPAGVSKATAELGPDAAAGLAADNADPAAAQRLAGLARQRFGRLDGGLISVGGPPGGTVAECADDQWRAAFESVFLGAVRLARVLAAAAGEGGSIAFVLSSSVRSPIPSLAISNGLRPGLAGVAKALADELGPAGIRVNGLMPGKIDTDRLRWLDERSGDPAQVRAASEQQIPLRRYGQPAEFGRAAAFVLSPAASYLTGAMIPVDGGAIRAL
ncbi:MAG: SDR family oxidoreductase [Actinobacteria bacterium]|nr:SDR family oxidoreductase [Actinomycetota bacterium]